jgi:L,D-transpeptidase ErfK/SrfK
VARLRLTPPEFADLPQTFVTIWRRRFRLAVHPIQTDSRKRGALFTCPVSIGRLGFETPPGRFRVLEKEMPPTYTAPDEQWAREAGYEPGEKLAADDPANPLRGAWLRLTWDGVGLHGSDSWPLGLKASHGCVRVRPQDAVSLHGLVDLGSPVVVL